MEKEDLDNRFKYHPPSDPGVAEQHEHVRYFARRMAEVIEQKCPDSREKSLAMTALEESMMWANAAIARNQGA
jgi:hypothetical protein